MPEKISLSGPADGVNPGLKPDPGQTPADPIKPPGSAPITLSGTVSEADAIGASDHSKITTISSLTGGSGGSGQSGQSVSVGSMIDGKLAVELMDATLPSLMVFLLFKIGLKLRKSELQLTEKEKSVLAPIVSKCLESLMINFSNPWAALAATLTAFYGSKLLPVMAEKMDEKQKAKQEGILKDKVKANEPEAAKMPPPPPPPPVDLNWEPSETMIKDKMKAHKYSRKRAIEVLKVLHNQRKL